MFQATIQEPDGKPVFDKYGIRATPTVVLFEADGTEYDWFVGYGPPPEKYRDQIDASLQGTGTYKAAAAAYAKDPKNVEAVFRLAEKWSDRYNTDKATEFYKQVLALDPEGRKGTTDFNNEKVTYTQLAEFNLATGAVSQRPPDVAPLQAFIKKYPESAIVKSAYQRLAGYFGRTAPKEEAAKFFSEYAARYPQDPNVLSTWVARIVFDKGPADQGIALAEKVIGLSKDRPNFAIYQSLGQLYLLKGDKAKAVEAADHLLEAANKAISVVPAVPATDAAAATAPPPSAAMLSSALPMAARIYVEAGQMEKALAVYGPDYAKKNQDSPNLIRRYVQFWNQQGQNLDSAAAAAGKITELPSATYSDWSVLGQIYTKQKKYAEALQAAEKALEVAPAQPVQIKDSIRKSIESIKAEMEKSKK